MRKSVPSPEVQSNTQSDSKNGKLKHETTRRKKPDIKEAVARSQGNKREKAAAAAAAAAANIVAKATTIAAADVAKATATAAADTATAARAAAADAAATATAAADAAAAAAAAAAATAATAADDAAANTAAAAAAAADAAFTTAAAAAAAAAAIVENAAANERYNRSLLEASLDPMVTISPDGKITDVNLATEKATGYSRKKLIGTDFTDYFTKPDKARESYKQVFSKGSVRDYPLELRHKNGHATPVLYNAIVYRNEAGEVEGVFAVARDVTEALKAERLIIELNDNLKRRAAELSAYNDELQSFSYSVSHDLRAPLRAINGFSQALNEDHSAQLDDKAKDYLLRITTACDRMGRMIDDMLKLSRVTRSDLAIEKIDISAIASEVAAEKMEEEPGRIVNLRIEPGLTADADAQLVRIMLENLFENAWKFTAKQNEATIEFVRLPNEQETVFCVRDNGVGFDQKYLEKLFNPFQRLHTTEEFPGTGIGLATVKRIVNRHGGKVWAEGKEGKGAAFYFTLP